MQRIFEYQIGLDRFPNTIVVSGDHIIPGESAVVMSNHRSFCDFYLLHVLAERANMLPHCRYFAKSSLKWIPGFGFGLWMSGMPLISRNWTKDKKLVDSMFKECIQYQIPIWMISYLEGTRYTEEKAKKSHEFARTKNLPTLNHVLVPRVKGFIATVNKLRDSHVRYVYDVTLGYYSREDGFGKAPSMWQVHTLNPFKREYDFHIHVRRFNISDLPKEEEELSKWVHDRFAKKDLLLNDMSLAFQKIN